MKRAILVIFFALTLAGCGTVSQNIVEAQNAGFYIKPVKVVKDGVTTFVVNADFRERYNALIEVYGHKKLENGAPVFLPPLVKDAGVTPTGAGGFVMTAEAMANMVVLSDLKRRGAAP